MRKSAALSVLIFLVLARPTAAQVPDDKLIVPGTRIGLWTLQMTIPELVGVLGRQIAIATRQSQLGADFQDDLRAYVWGVGLQAYTRDDRSILLLEAYKAPAFMTEKGIKFGMPRADVERAYGRPTRVTRWGTSPADVTLQYDEIGLEVFLSHDSTVGGVGVFRPGTASSIWKP